MESLNYHTRTFVLPSSAIGARHKRERLWIICRNLGDSYDYGFPTTKKCRGNEEIARGTRKGRKRPSNLREQVDPKTMEMYPTPTTKGFGHASEGQTMMFRRKVENGELTESRSSSHDEWSNFETTENGRMNYPTPTSSLKTQLQRQQGLLGEPSGEGKTDGLGNEDVSNGRRRKVELRLDGVVDGVSSLDDEPRGVPRIVVDQKDRANRLKALGNAIVPQNAKLIGLEGD